MCKPLAEGGKRCAAHTRPRYEAATFGTSEWDHAAAEYAATPSGRRALTQARVEAEEAGDLERTVAFAHALTEGQRLSTRAEAVRDALTLEPSPAERFAPVEQTMRDIAEELGYRRTLVRPNPTAPFVGTLVFQQGTQSTEVPYSVHSEGIAVRLTDNDVHPDTTLSTYAEREYRVRWDDTEAMENLTGTLRTVLERRRSAEAPDTRVQAPATAAELEDAFTAMGTELGYAKVRISDVPDSLSRYVDFLRPKKGRRMRYYSTQEGWSVRVRGRYPRLRGRRLARQGDTEMTVSASWRNEADSIEALSILRDLLRSLG